jgi:flavin reductase (DIM6/NTAB) family NADH-FMN oxidoreductase RutF
VERVDYCGLVSGADNNTSQVFDCFYGDDDKAPMISDCPVNLACKVIKTFEVHDMDVFIAEVVETLISEDCTTDGRADTRKTNPLIYCMDNLYWSIGDAVGRGFSIGKGYSTVQRG